MFIPSFSIFIDSQTLSYNSNRKFLCTKALKYTLRQLQKLVVVL